MAKETGSVTQRLEGRFPLLEAALGSHEDIRVLSVGREMDVRYTGDAYPGILEFIHNEFREFIPNRIRDPLLPAWIHGR